MTDQIITAEQLGKVAVLMGGRSSEREISLQSGSAVLYALQRLGIKAVAVDADRDVANQLSRAGIDRAFVALHGRGGEDGVIQGVLETLNIPYTGSGVLGSAITMNKLLTKRLWLQAGLPTPPYQELADMADIDVAIEQLGWPMAVKAAHEGSSIGVYKVGSREQLVEAWQKALTFDGLVIAEKWVIGQELTAAVLMGEALPLIRLETAQEFYDYEAKYLSDDTQYICPAGLSETLESRIRNLALQAFESVYTRDWGRVDFMLDQNQQPWLIEVNSVPGLTSHSLVPMAARAAGIEFDQLIWKLISATERK